MVCSNEQNTRRELRNDKNLIIELYSIIKKYLPDLLDKFEELTDTIHQSTLHTI